MSGMKSTGEGQGVVRALAKDNAKVIRKNKNCSTLVLSNGGGSGPVALDRAEGHAEIRDESEDGREAIVQGDHTDEVKKRVINEVFDSQDGVRVGIKFSDGSAKFWSRFKMDDTVYDIRARINKDDNRKVSDIMDSRTQKVFDEDTTIETLRKKDLLKNLTAVLKNSVPNDSSV